MPQRRKPIEVRKLEGTFRPDRHGNPALDGDVTPLGAPPEWMSAIAKQKWHELKADNPWLDNVSYRVAVEQFCVLYAISVNEARGKGEMTSSQRSAFQGLLLNMGLTPTTRAKVPLAKAAAKEKDPWSELSAPTITSGAPNDTPVQ